MKKTKKYDSVKMMREIRDKISDEIKNMDPEKILDYIKKGSEEFKKSSVQYKSCS